MSEEMQQELRQIHSVMGRIEAGLAAVQTEIGGLRTDVAGLKIDVIELKAVDHRIAKKVAGIEGMLISMAEKMVVKSEFRKLVGHVQSFAREIEDSRTERALHNENYKKLRKYVQEQEARIFRRESREAKQ